MFKVYAFRHKFACVVLQIILWTAGVLAAVGLAIYGKNDYKSLYFLVVMGLAASIPQIAPLYVNHCEVDIDTIFFYQFPNTYSLKKLASNVDSRWNQEAILSEIDSVEIVKLTKEEKKTKVFYKHFRNKYLKINMRQGPPKYVYIGGYSESQIKDICRICCEHKWPFSLRRDARQ